MLGYKPKSKKVTYKGASSKWKVSLDYEVVTGKHLDLYLPISCNIEKALATSIKGEVVA